MSTQHFGWLGYDAERRAWDEARYQSEERLYNEFSEVADTLPALKSTYYNRPFTWTLERLLYAKNTLPYEIIPAFFQYTGDCVAAGLAGAIQKLQVLELVMDGQEEEFREVFVPWIYGVSRNQIGGGKLRGDGSTGAWGARAVNEYGVLFCDDVGVPSYGKSNNCTSDDWGHRRNRGQISGAVYGKFEPVAFDNKVAVVRATSVDQMIELMDAGYQLTIASYRGFKVTEYKGFHVYRRAVKDWGHQMHITDLTRDPFVAFYRRNQWGDSHAKPLNGESPGGAWNLAEDVEDELRRGGVEVYGYRNLSGSPSGPDYNII